MALLPDVRLRWRALTGITNSSFLTDTTGWSVAAGINVAGTSITRTTGDGVLGGVTTNTCAELVTTGTSQSGAKFVMSDTFTSGRTYRFSVWLRSVSGTTSAKLLMGSLGTPADRASATMTLTTAWVRYSVDWTPSANRTDVQVNVTNNAAAVMTARICLADVYEAIDDIGAYGRNEVTALDWGRGASFDGSSESPGTASLTVNNIAQQYALDNASGPFTGLIAPGVGLWVRIVDTATSLVYGGYYGSVRRFVPDPRDKTVDILAEDPLFRFGRAEVSLGASVSRSIRDFRVAILAAIGEPVVRQDLAYGPESDIGYTGSDARLALGLLDDLNAATGTVHYIDPHPSPDVLYRYRTVDRTGLQAWTAAETIDDTVSPGINDLAGYDITDEALVTKQRVTPTIRKPDDEATLLWTSSSVPFGATVPRTFLALYVETDVAVSQTVAYSETGGPINSVTLTPYAHAGLIFIDASANPATITALSVSGRILREQAGESVSSGSGAFEGSVVTSDFIPSLAHAQGLADWIVFRYGTVKPRPDITVQNRTASHVTTDIAQVVTLSFGLLSIVSKPYYVRALRTTVSDNALVWRTTLALESAPAATAVFELDAVTALGLDDGVGGGGVLAY